MLRPSPDDIEARERDTVTIHDLDASWTIWLAWRFFNRTVPPLSGGFLAWPTWILDDLMTIDAQFEKLREQIDGK